MSNINRAAEVLLQEGMFEAEAHCYAQALSDAGLLAPDLPLFLKTEEDYASAPEGTIVASNDEMPVVLVDELWRHTGDWTLNHDEMAGIRRRVLRWGREA